MLDMKMNKCELHFPELPKKGDKLFTNEGYWKNNACLNFFCPEDNVRLYADGYKKVADIVVSYVENEGREHDYLVYPIISIYRYYFELAMKEIIQINEELTSGYLDSIKDQHHDLNKLWAKCRGIIEELWPEGPKEDLDAVEERINEFMQRDPFSIAFRYPQDKKGNQSHPDVDQINLKTMSERIKEISAIIEGARGQLSYMQDIKRTPE